MAAGDVGKLNSWTLNLIGKPDTADDTYVYTNEFAQSVVKQAGRATLSDASGTDTLNAAAVTGAMTINLEPGAVSTIDGRSLTIAARTTIENAIGGDGGDVIRGNAVDNVLRGMRGDDSLDGADGSDRLIGGPGNDTFDWDPAMRGGADTMEGGPGDDTYVLGTGDRVVELVNEGIDTIWTDVDASLLDLPEVENLLLFGQSAVSAAGNANSNRLKGNELSNSLKGLGGNDSLEGGAGNDSLDGGDGDDRQIGGTGNDTFDWDPAQRGGADTMEGGTGDDTYVLSAGDVVIELADGGTDSIWSAASSSLQDLPEVENLFLFGSAALNAYGNSKANRLRGNDQANVLSGQGGNDTLEGGPGSDSLIGGEGSDTAQFSGPRKNYTVTWSSSASAFTVVSAGEGLDTLTGIETLSFSDGAFSAEAMQTNTAPTLSNISALIGATEDTAYSVSWEALGNAADEADAQGDPIAFRVEAVSSGTLSKDGVAVVSGVTTVAEGETLTWTPAPNADGPLAAFQVRAMDATSVSTAAVQVTIMVVAVNDAPALNAPLPDRAASIGTPLNFTFGAAAFTDVETASLTYTATRADGTALPAWLAFNAGTRSFTGTPAAGDLGSISIKVTASDGSLSASDTFDVLVGPRPNTAPVAANVTSSTNEDMALTANLPTATDGEGDLVTYAKATNPSNGTVSVTSSGAYTYTPTANFSGSDAFSYTVSDGQGGSNTYTVSLSVIGVNDAPSRDVSISGTPTQGHVLTATNELTDPDGIPTSGADAITYQWLADGTPITGATSSSFTLTQAQVGKAVSVRASYTDMSGTAESVTSAPTAPVAAEQATTPLSGIVYHWKSHVLMPGVNVAVTSAPAVQPTAGDVFDLRSAQFNASTGVLSVEVWANAGAGAGFGNFDFRAATAGATSASFVSALPADWAVTINGANPQSVQVGGISLTSLNAATRLGTLQISLAPGSASAQVAFSNIALGSVAGADFVLNMQGRTTSADGGYSFASAPADPAIAASRSTTDSGSAITSADALAALRIAVGLNPNPDPDGAAGPKTAPAVSPYQIMAADVNNSGTVTSADALAILRMAVKLSTALTQEWFFVEEKRDFWDEVNQKFTLNRTSAAWDKTITVDPASGPVNLVGILKGDVNGSWVAPAGSTDLDVTDPTYFERLAQLIGVPNQDQWGGPPPGP